LRGIFCHFVRAAPVITTPTNIHSPSIFYHYLFIYLFIIYLYDNCVFGFNKKSIHE